MRRLVELTRAYPARAVPLSAIRELDECFWFDGTRPTCREVALHAKLIAETDLGYPIILGSDGRVMDGMHRVCRAFLDGRDSILAVRFQENPPPDYVDADLNALPYDDD